MKEFVAVAASFLSVVAYFEVSTLFSFYQPWPVVHILICLAASVWLVRLVARAKSTGRRVYGVVALLLSLGFVAIFVWYSFDYSEYDSAVADVAVGEDLGDRLATLSLASHADRATPVLRPGADRGTLLVFYRGFW